VIVPIPCEDGTSACQCHVIQQGWTYRLEVDGVLSDFAGWTFHDTSVRHDQGHNVLVGLMRDQPELQGLLQRVWDLGLTLLSVSAIEGGKDGG
jgi:hypothetical protein